jgi:diacylglycerol kinase family enzyme
LSRRDLPTVFIVNPRSAGGATASRLPELRKAADGVLTQVRFLETKAQGHASELARQAVNDGAGCVVAVGGDGTANEVVNGLFEERRPISDDVIFGVVPAGTGSDLIKTLGIPKDLEGALSVLATGEIRKSDVMLAQVTDPRNGALVARVGINVIGVGMAGDVVRRANLSSKRFGGTATFLGATLRSMVRYRPPTVRLTWDGPEPGSWVGQLANGWLANGQFCGGGMWVGRGASMQDGLMDLTIIPDLPTIRMIAASPRLFLGTMAKTKGVLTCRVRSLRADHVEGDAALVDVDGEQPGILPGNVEVLPKTLHVCGLWPT